MEFAKNAGVSLPRYREAFFKDDDDDDERYIHFTVFFQTWYNK